MRRTAIRTTILALPASMQEHAIRIFTPTIWNTVWGCDQGFPSPWMLISALLPAPIQSLRSKATISNHYLIYNFGRRYSIETLAIREGIHLWALKCFFLHSRLLSVLDTSRLHAFVIKKAAGPGTHDLFMSLGKYEGRTGSRKPFSFISCTLF